MSTSIPTKAKELRSLTKSDGTLNLSIEDFEVPTPKANEVIVKVEATAINPSDVGVIIGFSSLGNPSVFGTNESPISPAQLPVGIIPAYQRRFGMSLPAGNEGGGTVVAAGADAQHLLGKVVALFGCNAFAQYRCVPASSCMPMNEGTTPKEAAAACVNPLTVLGMVETMRMENHTAMINTAAASNLGQMLIKVCQDDNIPLVNIVRKEAQVELLKSLGASHVCNSSSSTFMKDLIAAVAETGATLGFDAIGGGDMVDKLLTAMEVAEQKKLTTYSPYGSTTHKQVYIYGGLAQVPTTLKRSYGMYWSVGGWLITPIIQRVGHTKFAQMRKRVADEIKTTFKSSFYKEISLEEMILPDTVCAYAKQESGKKYLVNPFK